MHARQHHIGGFAQPAPRLGGRTPAGFDKMMCNFAGQQHAVAVEPAFAICFVGEPVNSGIPMIVIADLGE
jgi:hypothetical protein